MLLELDVIRKCTEGVTMPVGAEAVVRAWHTSAYSLRSILEEVGFGCREEHTIVGDFIICERGSAKVIIQVVKPEWRRRWPSFP